MAWGSSGKDAILVLGMHRSGTSALAGTLPLLGIDLGEHLGEPAADNPKGFFEDFRATRLHEAIFESMGLAWHFPSALPLDWPESAPLAELRGRLANIAREFVDRGRPWCLKDPRLSRLLPAWTPVVASLGLRVRYVVMVRDPTQVAASLARRGDMSHQEGLWLWLAYMLDAERHTRGASRAWVSYDDLLDSPVVCMERLAERLGLRWPIEPAGVEDEIRGFLDPALRHHRAYRENEGPKDTLPTPVARLFATLNQAASTGEIDEHEVKAVRAAFRKRLRAQAGYFETYARLVRQQIETRSELMRMSDWGSEMKQQQEVQHRELMALSDWAGDLQEQLETRVAEVTAAGGRIAELEQQVRATMREREAEHEELMKMSDWAYGMKQRLADIDRSLVMSLAQPLMGLEFGALGRMNRLRELSRRGLSRAPRGAPEAMGQCAPLRESIGAKGGRLLVVFPIITWDFRWQRPQHLVSRMVRQGFAGLYLAMGLSPAERRYKGFEEAGAEVGFNTLDDHIHQVWLHSRRPLNVYTDPVEGDDLNNLRLGLGAVLRAVSPSSVVYLLQFPGWTPLALELREELGGKLVFDCMDDHGGFSTNTEAALRAERELLEQADLVIVSSDLLQDKARQFNASTLMARNATEFEHFHEATANGELDRFTDRPVIGYYGAISDWFDMELILYCARERPQWELVLIGHTFGCDIREAKGLKNVHFLGEKPYRELPGFVAYFDVCLIPFKVIPLTLATNPVKLYEYFSTGKPVVSVDLPEVRAYRECCYLATNQQEFLEGIDQALAEKEDPERRQARIAVAKDNSWDNRVRTILEQPALGMTQ